MGSGLTRINSSVLADQVALLGEKNDLRDMLFREDLYDNGTRTVYISLLLSFTNYSVSHQVVRLSP